MDNSEKSTEDSLVEISNDIVDNTDVNAKNKAEYETVMKNAEIKKDDYYDRNSPIVRIVLILLFIFIMVSFLYYLFTFLNS